MAKSATMNISPPIENISHTDLTALFKKDAKINTKTQIKK